MGNGVKVVLVALLVIAVVVVAKVVQEDTNQPGKVPANALVTAKKSPESSGAVKLPAKTGQRPAVKRPAVQRPAVKRSGTPGQAPRKTSRDLKFTNRPRNSAVSASRTTKRNTAEKKPGASPSRRAMAKRPSTTRQGSANATIPSPAGSYNPPTRPKRENILEARVGPLASNTEGFRPLAPPPSSSQKTGAATPVQSPSTPLVKEKPAAGKRLPVSSRVTKPAGGKVLAKAREQKKTTKAARTAKKPKAVKYVVKSGDSYWGIAKKHYGSGGLHEFIKKANAGKKLHPGMTITIPEKAAKKSKPTKATNSRASLVSRNVSKSATPKTTTKKKKSPARAAANPHGLKESSDGRYFYYVVERGDTLSALAVRFKTGSMDRIKEANRSLFYTDLLAGQKIRIPKS